MSNQQVATMTAADFASVAQKLEQFSCGLAPGEQAVLQALLHQALAAAAGDSEVSGYDLRSIPLPQGDILRAFGVA